MFWPSEVLVASVPMPTVTPARSISRTGATPEPSRRLLDGDAVRGEPVDVVALQPDRMRDAQPVRQEAERLEMRSQARAITRPPDRGLRARLGQMRLQADTIFQGEPAACDEEIIGAMQRDRRPERGTNEAAIERPICQN